MASTYKGLIIICKISPSSSSATINQNYVGFSNKATINPHHWTIPHQNSALNSPSSHFVTPPNQQIISINEDEICSKLEKKLSRFRHALIQQGSVQESLDMIDAIQRLGIDYHFEEDIDEILKKHYNNYHIFEGSNLREITLQFRLMRQQGYYIQPSGMLENFKSKDGRFKKNLNDDIRGVMELYEASQMSIGGEDYELDEARYYSYGVLSSWMNNLNYHQARIVKNTIDHPHHKSLAILMAENYSTYYEGGCGWWRKELLDISKLNLKVLRSEYRQDIVQISRWWDETGISKELKFARNQPMKWYIWAMAILNDPKLSDLRIDLTKPIAFIYLIDDIFDVYATLDQLISFTQVIDRWDISESEHLPDYMRLCFKTLDQITDEISYKIYKQHGFNPTDSLRKSWGSLCKAFLVEARWFSSGKKPKTEEYLKNGIISSGVHVVLVHIFFLLGHGANKQDLNPINDNPEIISSVAAILRLWDDLGSAKDEDQNGYDGSYVELHMNENKGCTIENARKQVTEMISESWKKLNKECLFPTPYSCAYRKCCLNLARMVPLMYSYDHNQDLPVLKHYVNSLLGNDNASILNQ